MNIAFCINKLGMIGLGATLSSTIRNCSDSQKLKIFFLSNGLSLSDKDKIKNLLKNEFFFGKSIFIDFDPDYIFKGLRSLHGDFTTYGRLLLADLVNEDQVLYLDSDLIVELDVLKVSNFDFKGKLLAAVDAGTLKFALENKFFSETLGLSQDLSTFNAGVILFNLTEWRLKNTKERCLEIGHLYPNDLLSCDQTILNVIFAGNFERLPNSFNCPWYANKKKPNVSDKMIIHFVGSPKPWDIFGRFLHKGYAVWEQYATYEWVLTYKKYSIKELKRTWMIRRSYMRLGLNKIKDLI